MLAPRFKHRFPCCHRCPCQAVCCPCDQEVRRAFHVTSDTGLIGITNSFCRTLPQSIVGPHCINAIAAIAPLLPHASEATLVLLIDTIEAAVKVSTTELDDQDAASLFGAILDIWSLNAQGSRPYFISFHVHI